jgi:hypothetical protein
MARPGITRSGIGVLGFLLVSTTACTAANEAEPGPVSPTTVVSTAPAGATDGSPVTGTSTAIASDAAGSGVTEPATAAGDPAGEPAAAAEAPPAGDSADPAAEAAAAPELAMPMGDSGEIADQQSFVMPSVIGLTVDAGRQLIAGADIRYTDDAGTASGATDGQHICAQTPAAGTDVVDGVVVLAVADSC